MTWAELADLLRAAPGWDFVRLQGVYPAGADLWAEPPATVAVYLIPVGGAWLVHVTAIALNGQARCNLLANFLSEDAAQVALMNATRAVYPGGGKDGG